MANKLTIDFDALDYAIKQYEEASKNFGDMISALDKTVDELKNSEWKSSAATAFFASYDDNWRVNMEKHILIINHLRECLEKARSDYHELADEASELEAVLRIN